MTTAPVGRTSYNGGVSSVDVKAEYAGLVKAAAAGDRGAMEALPVRAQEVAYRFSLLVCGHEAVAARRRTLELRVRRTRHRDQHWNGSRGRGGSISLDRSNW